MKKKKISLSQEIYEKHYPLLTDYIARNKIRNEEHISFLNLKFCEIVNRYYRDLGRITCALSTYLQAGLTESEKDYYKNKNKHKREISVDPTNFDEQVEIMEGKEKKADTALNKRLKKEGLAENNAKLKEVWVESVGWMDMKSDLLADLNLVEIAFSFFNLAEVKHERIAKDFKCSKRTVDRVISSAKDKIKSNAQKLGYKI